MTTEILGAAMDHKIDTKLQRLLVYRSGDRVIDNSQQTVLFCKRGESFQISQSQERVARRLHQDQFRAGSQRVLKTDRIGLVYKAYGDAKARKEFAQKTCGAGVMNMLRNHVISSANER